MSDSLRILLVEDNPGDADLFREMLPGYGSSFPDVACVPRLADAVSAAAADRFDVVLLDLDLPDSVGLPTLRGMRRQAQLLPIIVLTGNSDEQTGLDAIREGAQDYLVKGLIDKNQLARSIKYAIERKQAENDLKDLNDTLEERIVERTAQISSANEALHLEIAERKLAVEAQLESEERYRTLFNTLMEGFCVIEMLFDAEERPTDYRFLETNPAFDEQTGLRDARGRLMREMVPEYEAHWFEIYGKVALTGVPAHFVSEAKALCRCFNVSAYRVGGAESRKVAILLNDISNVKQAEHALTYSNKNLETRVAQRTEELAVNINQLRLEISERIAAQESILRMNRLYSVLFETKKAILHIKDRSALFRDFCRIAVENGNFKLACVGLVDEASGEVNMTAGTGATGYLEGIRITVNQEPAGLGPTGMSIRSGTHYICNDFLADANTRLWHERGLVHGIRASASIALRQEEKVIGALTLFADQKDFFDYRQVTLLCQMGEDVSFALSNIAREDRRMEAEDRRMEAEERSMEAERRLCAETAERLTEREQSAQKIEQLAHFDHLTSLPNRFSLMERLFQALELAKRLSGTLAVMFIDLDHFKNINDSLGHHIGDTLLVQVAQRLTESVRSADIVARVGGDEFVVVLPLINSALAAEHAASKIQRALSQTYSVKGRDFNITASTGICLFPQDGESVDDLMKNADIALYHAKNEGRNNHQFFKQEMNLTAQARLVLESDLRVAIEREEFLLYYQPQVDMVTGRAVGVEALVRWQHPKLGLIQPDSFIPIAEDTRLILPIGELVLKIACRQLAAWIAAGLPPLRMAVNLSARQFNHTDLPGLMWDIITETGIDPHLLELEITESAAMDNPESAILNLCRLRDMGFELAIDDFGTGYSSLSYLKHFPVSRLKIDRSFVKDIGNSSDDSAIAAATIALVRTLGKESVAEGVETEAQMSFLRDERCDIVQGYLISRPLPAGETTEFLQRNRLVAGTPWAL